MRSLLSLKIVVAKELFRGAVKFALKDAGRPIYEHYNFKCQKEMCDLFIHFNSISQF